MNCILMALGDTPAGEGIGGAIMAILAVLGVFALIYALLEIMDRYTKKKGGSTEKTEMPPAKNKEFIDVLAEKMQEKEDEDRTGRA